MRQQSVRIETPSDGLGDEVQPVDQRRGMPPGVVANPVEKFAEVGPGPGRHRIERVAFQSGEIASIHPVITLEVPDLRFDRT